MKEWIKRTQKIRLTILGGMLILTLGVLALQNLSLCGSPQEDAIIDWGDGVITVTGISKPVTMRVNPTQAKALSTRSAVVNAQQKLTEVINSLIVTSKTVGEDITKDKKVKEKIKKVVKKLNVTELKYLSDGSARIKATLSLFGPGSVGEVLYPYIIPPSAVSEDIATEIEIPSISSIGEMRAETEDEFAEGEAYTGLIVDARSIDLRPAMSPTIHTEDGELIYGSLDVNPDYVTSVGIASYASSVEEAKHNTLRVGNNPVVVTALDAKGPFRADAIIGSADGEKIKDASRQINFLKKLKVIFVTR